MAEKSRAQVSALSGRIAAGLADPISSEERRIAAELRASYEQKFGTTYQSPLRPAAMKVAPGEMVQVVGPHSDAGAGKTIGFGVVERAKKSPRGTGAGMTSAPLKVVRVVGPNSDVGAGKTSVPLKVVRAKKPTLDARADKTSDPGVVGRVKNWIRGAGADKTK